MSEPISAIELPKDHALSRARGGQNWKAARERAASFDWDRALELNRRARRELYGA